MAATLEVRDVSLAFGGVQALQGVTLDLAAGEVLGLIGPNGSGKTSVLNVVSGLYRPDTGRVLLDGAEVTGAAPRRMVAQGVVRSHQTPRVYPRMTVAGNLLAARDAMAPWHRAFRVSPGARRADADAVTAALAQVGLSDRAGDMPDRLTPVEMRLLEIARALSCRPRLLLLDEPAAGMTSTETERLARVLADHVLPGLSALVVEHKVGFVSTLCDRLAVFRAGRVMAGGTPQEVLADPAVRSLWLGEAPS